MKKVREILYEKFKEESDPIKDMGIGSLKVFVIEVNLPKEEWQMNAGIDLIIARNELEAEMIWKKEKTKYYSYRGDSEIRSITEIDISKQGFHHIQDPAVE